MEQVFKEVIAHLILESGLSLFKVPHDSLVVNFPCLINYRFVAWISLILLQLFLSHRLGLDQMTLSDVPIASNGVRVLSIGLIKVQLTDSDLPHSFVYRILF